MSKHKVNKYNIKRNLNRPWHLASWAIESMLIGIAIVGYIYDNPNFKDGKKVYIPIKAKRIYKYTL